MTALAWLAGAVLVAAVGAYAAWHTGAIRCPHCRAKYSGPIGLARHMKRAHHE